MSSGSYDVAQICVNGHVVTSRLKTYPHHRQEFCSDCGVKTITDCQACNGKIRGGYISPGVHGIFDYKRPSYCCFCGDPYPWTAEALRAAGELIDEDENLEIEDKQKLRGSLKDLVNESPQTAVAETRFKRLSKKAGIETLHGLKSVLVNVISETVKQNLYGP